jgi:hypothetical protein
MQERQSLHTKQEAALKEALAALAHAQMQQQQAIILSQRELEQVRMDKC